jgi:hypothetical protein
VFTHRQRGKIKLTETARVGDHARVIEATFVDPNAKTAPPLGAAPPPTADKASHGVPVLTYVLGGVGVAGLGSFLFLRIAAVRDYNDYNSTCSPACNPDDIDGLRTKFTMSYVSLGIGVAGLAGAGLVYFLTPRESSHPVQASIAPRGDGATLDLRTRF